MYHRAKMNDKLFAIVCNKIRNNITILIKNDFYVVLFVYTTFLRLKQILLQKKLEKTSSQNQHQTIALALLVESYTSV